MKKLISALLIILMTCSLFFVCATASTTDENAESETNNKAENDFLDAFGPDINSKSAVLINADTGALLYAKNPNVPLPPASVTKIMTLLLVAEALENDVIRLQDEVLISENAASMGGSQIFLKEGEKFTVEELIKSTVIASANDAAVALAEYVFGSEKQFVEKMNARAAELGLKNTFFENATGLDESTTKHLISAMDIALMSKELIKHDIILKYSNVWQDSIRDGKFVLTNTNRLVRYYKGCTGLKTGSTDKAGFCVSATAKRDGMHLIAVIMGAQTRDERNAYARELLDFGFANYAIFKDSGGFVENVPVYRGNVTLTELYSQEFKALVKKSDKNKIEKKYVIADYVTAPLKAGDVIGKIVYSVDGKVIGEAGIYIKNSIDEISYFELWGKLLSSIFTGR